MSEASKGYRYDRTWRQVSRANGTSAGQTRQRGRNIEYRGPGEGGTYGGYMQTAAARSAANNVTQRVNNRLNRRR